MNSSVTWNTDKGEVIITKLGQSIVYQLYISNMKKRFISIICAMFYCFASFAFSTQFMSVDFDKMELTYDGKTYELVEVKKKQRQNWREVTYLCIDKDLHAVAFRLFVTDDGDFIRIQKYTSKK